METSKKLRPAGGWLTIRPPHSEPDIQGFLSTLPAVRPVGRWAEMAAFLGAGKVGPSGDGPKWQRFWVQEKSAHRATDRNGGVSRVQEKSAHRATDRNGGVWRVQEKSAHRATDRNGGVWRWDHQIIIWSEPGV